MKIIGVDMDGKPTSFALSNGKQAWILPDVEPAGVAPGLHNSKPNQRRKPDMTEIIQTIAILYTAWILYQFLQIKGV